MRYRRLDNWGQLPDGWALGDTPGVAVNSKGHVFVLNRSEHPVVIFDKEGRFLDSWEHAAFRRPHALCIGPDDSVYIVDDQGHAIHKFNANGTLLLSIETKDHPSNTGYRPGYPETVQRAGPPFNHPTGLALSPSGEMYVSDGYGNARVHKFSPEGRLLYSWGEPGVKDGQFLLPHGICCDRAEQVYVADRENSRVQIFSPKGDFLAVWSDAPRASSVALDPDGNFLVTEMGLLMQGPPGNKHIVKENAWPRITIRSPQGKILEQWRPDDHGDDGVFFSPHCIAMDSNGDIYVSEVPRSYSGGLAPPTHAVLTKYWRAQ